MCYLRRFMLLGFLFSVAVCTAHTLSSKEAILQKLTSFQAELSKVKESIEGSKSQISSLQTKISELQSSLTASGLTIQLSETKINGLESSLASSAVTIQLSETKIGELESSLIQSKRLLLESQQNLQAQEILYKALLKESARLHFLLRLFQISSAVLAGTTVILALLAL